jgi:rhomboid protease GluP
MGFDTFIIQLVCLSCGFLLLRTAVSPRGWVLVAGVTLLAMGSTFLLAPALTAWVGGFLWLFLIFLPLLGLGAINRLVVQERYGSARVWAIAVRWLHPLDGLREYPALLRGLELGQQGRMEEAIQIFNRYQTADTAIGRTAAALLFRMDARWQEVLEWVHTHLPGGGVYRDAGLGTVYLRSLGETGDLNGLLHGFERFEREMQKTGNTASLNLVKMFALAFCGQADQVQEMFASSLAIYPDSVHQFWLATAELAAGQEAIGRQRLQALLNSTGGIRPTDVAQEKAIQYRLSQSSPNLNNALAASSKLILLRLRTDQRQETQYSLRLSLKGGRTYATLLLIAANILVFGIQIAEGGPRDAAVLYKMGALIPELVMAGEWWRTLTANFLHLNLLHLLSNMLGLYLFGRFVETNLGQGKFLLAYFCTGIGAMTTVAVLAVFAGSPDIVCVGASGAVMGMLGVMGAIMLRGWRRDNIHFAGRQLRLILILVGLQTLSDLFNPEVSLVGHVSGLVFGFLLGYGLTSLRSPLKPTLRY